MWREYRSSWTTMISAAKAGRPASGAGIFQPDAGNGGGGRTHVPSVVAGTTLTTQPWNAGIA